MTQPAPDLAQLIARNAELVTERNQLRQLFEQMAAVLEVTHKELFLVQQFLNNVVWEQFGGCISVDLSDWKILDYNYYADEEYLCLEVSERHD